MARSSHSLAVGSAPHTDSLDRNPVQETVTGRKLDRMDRGQDLAMTCLNQIASPKEWASALEVTDRQIRRWAVAEQGIPPLRFDQIIRQAKTFLMAERKLEESIDRLLLEQYGPHDRGRF